MTMIFAGSRCCASVARSPIAIDADPSPVIATTCRLGNATCAPIA